MNTKHTSGTWHAKDGQIYPTETGKTLAIIPYYDKDNEEEEANAKLIAAAPELLKALGNICHKLQEHQKKDSKIIAGYTLAANIEGMTELLIEATRAYSGAISFID
jgi:hypothetical protein